MMCILLLSTLADVALAREPNHREHHSQIRQRASNRRTSIYSCFFLRGILLDIILKNHSRTHCNPLRNVGCITKRIIISSIIATDRPTLPRAETGRSVGQNVTPIGYHSKFSVEFAHHHFHYKFRHGAVVGDALNALTSIYIRTGRPVRGAPVKWASSAAGIGGNIHPKNYALRRVMDSRNHLHYPKKHQNFSTDHAFTYRSGACLLAIDLSLFRHIASRVEHSVSTEPKKPLLADTLTGAPLVDGNASFLTGRTSLTHLHHCLVVFNYVLLLLFQSSRALDLAFPFHIPSSLSNCNIILFKCHISIERLSVSHLGFASLGQPHC